MHSHRRAADDTGKISNMLFAVSVFAAVTRGTRLLALQLEVLSVAGERDRRSKRIKFNGAIVQMNALAKNPRRQIYL